MSTNPWEASDDADEIDSEIGAFTQTKETEEKPTPKKSKKRPSGPPQNKKQVDDFEAEAKDRNSGPLSFTDEIVENPGKLNDDQVAAMLAKQFTPLKKRAKKSTFNVGAYAHEKVGKTHFLMTAARFNGLIVSWDDFDYFLDEDAKMVDEKGFFIDDMNKVTTQKTKKKFTKKHINAGSKEVPPGWPVYIVDTEFGTDELEAEFDDVSDKIHVISIYEDDEKTMEADPVKSLIAADKALTALTYLKQGTVAFDSFPDILDWMNGTLRVKVLKKDKNADILPKDYYWRNDKLRGTVMKILSIPGVHSILTAQMREIWEKASGGTGRYKHNFNEKIPYWLNTVAHLQKSEVKEKLVRWLDITDTRYEVPTYRFPKRPLRIVNPDFSQMAHLLALGMVPSNYRGEIHIQDL